MRKTWLYDQGVFDVYLGLTASGYELASADAQALTEAILAGSWDHAALKYFRQARIDDGRVNPYWPRGSILAAISLLASREGLITEAVSVRDYLSELTNVPPAERDDDTVQWAAVLSEQIVSLRAASQYENSLLRYREAVHLEAEKHWLAYRERVGAAEHVLRALFPTSAHPRSVRTILNPLQADQLTDVVTAKESVYVVTSHLRVESCVHEMVHVYADPLLRDWMPRILEHADLLDATYEPMVRMRYAWDRSASSWANVFSETLARVLTVWAMYHHDREGLIRQIEATTREGFLYATLIVERLNASAEGQPLTEHWLQGCLSACHAVVNPDGSLQHPAVE